MRIAGITRWCRLLTAAATTVMSVADSVALAGMDVPFSKPRAGAVQDARATPEQQKAIDAYVAELKRITGTQGASLENLLAAAYNVATLLYHPPGPQELPRPGVDELSPDELQRIRKELNGLDIHIGDTVSVMPDREFFLSRARSNGRSVDIQFFALLNRAYPPSGWPVWIERTGPESGCVDFTSGELVDLFAAWRRFQAANPGSYASAVARELGDMEDDLLADDRRLCAQDMDLVGRELQRFLSLFPQDPLAAKIRTRSSSALP